MTTFAQIAETLSKITGVKTNEWEGKRLYVKVRGKDLCWIELDRRGLMQVRDFTQKNVGFDVRQTVKEVNVSLNHMMDELGW